MYDPKRPDPPHCRLLSLLFGNATYAQPGGVVHLKSCTRREETMTEAPSTTVRGRHRAVLNW